MSYAVTSSGRPIGINEQPATGDKVIRHIAEPYAFEMDGAKVASAEPCTTLRPCYDPLYRQTKPFDFAAGEHTVLVRVWASEDMFRFLKNNSNLEGNPDFKSNWETTMTAYPELTAEQRAARPKRPAIRPAENKTPEMLYNGLGVEDDEG